MSWDGNIIRTLVAFYDDMGAVIAPNIKTGPFKGHCYFFPGQSYELHSDNGK